MIGILASLIVALAAGLAFALFKLFDVSNRLLSTREELAISDDLFRMADHQRDELDKKRAELVAVLENRAKTIAELHSKVENQTESLRALNSAIKERDFKIDTLCMRLKDIEKAFTLGSLFEEVPDTAPSIAEGG